MKPIVKEIERLTDPARRLAIAVYNSQSKRIDSHHEKERILWRYRSFSELKPSGDAA